MPTPRMPVALAGYAFPAWCESKAAVARKATACACGCPPKAHRFDYGTGEFTGCHFCDDCPSVDRFFPAEAAC